MRFDYAATLGPLAAVILISCSLGTPTTDTKDRKSALRDAPCRTERFAWGDGATQFGFEAAKEEHVASGPTAVAFDQTGRPLILDARNNRVVAVSKAGDPALVLANIPRDVEDLSVAPDGAIALYSPLRSSITVYSQGQAAGTITVARNVRKITGFDIKASRRIEVRNAYQETFALGSPHAPRDLASVWMGKREGVFEARDGSSLQASLHDGQGRLETVGGASPQHYALGAATSVRVVGVTDNTACVLVESVTQAGALAVTRRIVCVDLATSKRTFETQLPPVGAYVPLQQVALSRTGTLVALRPTNEGLDVMSCRVHSATGGAQ